jgi:hypothetical protein
MDGNAVRKRAAALGTAGALLASLGPAAPALAHSFTATSKVTITYENGRFQGRVESSRAPRFCRYNRKVKVFKVRPGDDKFIGEDQTGRQGKWKVFRPGAHGRFYAKVKPKVRRKP